jgi:nucleoid-associated protein YgaU
VALEKATLTNTVSGEVIPVMFNPEEYTLNRDINYAQTAIPGLSAPLIQFVNGNLQTLEMELFLDTYEEHREGGVVLNAAGADVRDLTARVTGLMSIDASTHAPPVLLFVWGSLSFTCVLARASQRFTMFLSDGTPVRANVQVTFNEFRNAELEARQVKRETVDYTKTHVALDGETLSAIAAREYGSPKTWRPIALANNIDDPRDLSTGKQLVIPHLPYRDPRTAKEYPS